MIITRPTIGEVAKLLAVSPATLRHYEKKKLISPSSKSEFGYRLYSEKDINRIYFIRNAQSHGLALADIKQLIKLEIKDAQIR